MAHFIIIVATLLFLYYARIIYDGLFPDDDNLEEVDKRLEEANHKCFMLSEELGATKAALQNQGDRSLEITKELVNLTQRFEKLQFSKISSEVKLGQKAEHLLPFLESFPYRDDEIKGLFQPVDLIVFREDEVVFVEVKTGAAQLSEKERRIRDNIKAGRVRFEVHRMNEKGVTVK